MKMIYDIDNIKKASNLVITHLNKSKIALFYGDLGAGKTTLIKDVAKSYLNIDNISSPTFSLINKHHNINKTLYHCDLYRIKTIEELFDIGFEDMLHSQDYIFIEWADIATDLIYMPHNKIFIKKIDHNLRSIEINPKT